MNATKLLHVVFVLLATVITYNKAAVPNSRMAGETEEVPQDDTEGVAEVDIIRLLAQILNQPGVDGGALLQRWLEEYNKQLNNNNGAHSVQEEKEDSWSSWGEWSPCNTPCSDKGYRVRNRTCNAHMLWAGEQPKTCLDENNPQCGPDDSPCLHKQRENCGNIGCPVCQDGGECCCQNGGTCYRSENPYGWGWMCVCPRGTGGHLCQFRDACSVTPCPQSDPFRSYSPAHTQCYATQANNIYGRYCAEPYLP